LRDYRIRILVQGGGGGGWEEADEVPGEGKIELTREEDSGEKSEVETTSTTTRLKMEF
jgi:hypothetical protein